MTDDWAVIEGYVYAEESLAFWDGPLFEVTFFSFRHLLLSDKFQVHFLRQILYEKECLTILITGIEAVSIDLKLSRHLQFSSPHERLRKSSIILYLSSMCRPVTARSISLDSSASPVTRDPNSSSFGYYPEKTFRATFYIHEST